MATEGSQLTRLTLDYADWWCRHLYYDRLKTLDLKGKKVLELGCDIGLVTEKLIKDKSLYQYECLESVDSLERCIEICKKKIPYHTWIHDCITSENVDKYLKYDTYLIFYTYPVIYKNEMLRILRRLVNEFHKEVVLYESLIDDFNHSGIKYKSTDLDVFLRLKTDSFLRVSNQLVYEREFKVKYKNGFTYLYPKK